MVVRRTFATFYAHHAKPGPNHRLPSTALGGQPALFSIWKILDVPGFPNLTGGRIDQHAIEQLNGFDTIHLNETVLEIEKQEEGFVITTSKGSPPD